MLWRKCPRVQTVGALLLRRDTLSELCACLSGIKKRSTLFAAARISVGNDWLVIEGVEDKDRVGDLLLPSLSGALALYEAFETTYCAVGYQLDAPAPLHRALLANLKERLSLQGPLVLVPDHLSGGTVEVFELDQARALNEIDLSELQ